ncbi:MAG TPA: L-erythro-3,5-diaminohexanoate dehydrogenase [Ktedonobacterales bacterium]
MSLSPRLDPALRALGVHRVLEPSGSSTLPQNAWRLDNTPVAAPDEMAVAVHALHIDSASFTQISRVCNGDTTQIAAHLLEIVRQRGKMHNPVTGSGGVLVGKVIGLPISPAPAPDPATHPVQPKAALRQTVVSLTSLSWLPLHLERILAVHPAQARVDVEGTAIFFACNPFALLPDDLPEPLALAALDVAGAPSRAQALARPGMRVVVLGAGGTAGLLTLCALRPVLGEGGHLLAIEYDEAACADIVSLGVADKVIRADATNPIEMLTSVHAACGSDYLADLAINVVNVPGTEFATILLTSPAGTTLFFSMATSFTTAALGAEGLGRATVLQIGNGLMPDLGAVALHLLREHAPLRAIFTRRFGAASPC